jgi:hypothetical protein
MDTGNGMQDTGDWTPKLETRDWTSIGSAVGGHLAQWPLGASSGSFDTDSWAILGRSFCTELQGFCIDFAWNL